MVSHAELSEAFHEEVALAPRESMANAHEFAPEPRKILTQIGIPESFDNLIIVDSELKVAGPRSLKRVYEELGDESPSAISHLRRFASLNLDSLCFDGLTGKVYLIPHDSPERIAEIEESLAVFIDKIYVIKKIRNNWLDGGAPPSSPLQVQEGMRQRVTEIGGSASEGTTAFWNMVIVAAIDIAV